MPVISVMGRIGYDLYADDPNVPLDRVRHFRSGLGGSSANIAVGLARLGCEVHMLAAISDDLLGEFLTRVMASEGIDISLVQPVPFRTSLSLTEVCPPHSFRQVFYRNDPADAHLAWNDALEGVIRRSQIFVTNGTSLCADPSRHATLRALEVARESKVTTVFDVDYRASSWNCPEDAGRLARQVWSRIDLLLANADEIRLLAEDPRGGAAEAQVADAALQNGVEAVIWKRGAEGATCFTAGGQFHAPAFEVPVTSTIGAGDSFGAGFIYAYAQGKPLTDCLRYGNACAAIVVQEVGCAEAMPTLARLEAFLAVEGGALPIGPSAEGY
jgi:5-dehydro-2-deoxygluconokinase